MTTVLNAQVPVPNNAQSSNNVDNDHDNDDDESENATDEDSELDYGEGGLRRIMPSRYVHHLPPARSHGQAICARARLKIMTLNGFPNPMELLDFQSESVEEHCGQENVDLSNDQVNLIWRANKPMDIRNTLYHKIKKWLRVHQLHDPATQQTILYTSNDPADKAMTQLYVTESWFYASCTRDAQGKVVVIV